MMCILLVITLSTALGIYSHELLFIAALISFVVVTELTAPESLVLSWRAQLRWVMVVGLIGIAFIVVRRALARLPEGLLP